MSQLPPHPPPYQPPRTNGLGTAGFVVSLVAIFTGGLLFPIALLLSFFALFRRPRGLAFAGFIISFIGTAIIVGILSLFGTLIWQVVKHGKPMVATFQTARVAQQRIDSFAMSNGGALPSDPVGEALLAGEADGWGHPLLYHRVNNYSFELRSAGSDGIPNTDDDYEQMFDLGR